MCRDSIFLICERTPDSTAINIHTSKSVRGKKQKKKTKTTSLAQPHLAGTARHLVAVAQNFVVLRASTSESHLDFQRHRYDTYLDLNLRATVRQMSGRKMLPAFGGMRAAAVLNARDV